MLNIVFKRNNGTTASDLSAPRLPCVSFNFYECKQTCLECSVCRLLPQMLENAQIIKFKKKEQIPYFPFRNLTMPWFKIE